MKRKLLTAALIASITMEVPAQEKVQQHKSELVAEVCGIVVLGVGAVVIYKLAKFCQKHLPPRDPPPPPKSPPSSNAVSQVQTILSGSLPELICTNDVCSDISGWGWVDAQGAVYATMFAYAIESSTNMVSWQQECSLTGWVSDATVCTMLYSNGVPISTNWLYNWQQQTNTVTMPFTPDMSAKGKFFRLSCNTNY